MQLSTPGFVRIKTLFKKNGERTVEQLQQLYADRSFLLSLVKELSAGILEADNLAGKKILLKPNWVKHFAVPADEICLCTHHNFLLAVLELVLSKKPASVIIGDAPIQGCHWNRLVTTELYEEVAALSGKYNIPVTIKDFRRVAFDTLANKLDEERNPMDEYVIFDTGKNSYLEPVTTKGKNLFRVSQYNPDRFTATHAPGMHKYCITKELFNADIVISLPKVKTHQKTGITCALKNIVGLNGDKDFLPHHRIGGTGMGGDSYPGNSRLRYWSELALDNANRRRGKKSYWYWLRFSIALWILSRPKKQHQLSAAWFGNDTTWRMVMDLNMVVNFGKADGTLSDTPQRFLYSFCDGIIGGQGDGPLKPTPLNLGVVCFTNESAMADVCMAELLGLDVSRIPLLQAALSFKGKRETLIQLNDSNITTEELRAYAAAAILPPGWENYTAT